MYYYLFMSQVSFIKLLEQFCHINDIPWTDKWKNAGQIIIDHPERKLISAARLGYVLQAFQKFVRKEIDEEVFFGTGEVWGTEPVVMPDRGNELIGWLQIQEQLQTPAYPVSLLVIDATMSLFAPQSESILKKAEEKGLIVVTL